ncbi:MAG TPA: hypothetical protein VKB42_06100 [Dongiaceae bacterium]|nr:hypothetical protein [Dongiaceae bacterium]
MASISASDSASGAGSLRALYESTLGPYLAAQDRRVMAARRNRWLVLVAGLALAGAVLAWAWQSGGDSEYGPMAGFGLALGSIGYFWFATATIAEDVRHELMGRIAKWLGFGYEAEALGFDLDRFALLGLAGCDKVNRSDRLFGKVSGLPVDLMAARLADESSTGVGSQRHSQTIERFSGLLLHIADPVSASARFRLLPAASATPHGILRGSSVVTQGRSADLRAMPADGAESTPATPTGDAAFDARFELQAEDVSAALSRLDAGTRSALLDIAGHFGGGPVSVGFDTGEILFAFVTRQRFEIGPLRPPMAEFERVQHLADRWASWR